MPHTILTSGGRPQQTLTNIYTNTNFDDTTGWTVAGSTITATSNTISVTGNGSSVIAGIYQDSTSTWTDGKVAYVKAVVLVTNSVCQAIRLRLGVSTTIDVATILTPTINTWYTLYGNLTETDQVGNPIRVVIRADYADAATANNKVLQVRRVVGLDLTAQFGAGKEPTDAQIIRWQQIFNGGWFETKNIPKRIY